MVNTASNVLSGKPLATGGILRGAVGSTLPTDATTAPGASFNALGYVGEDGVTETQDRSTDKIKAWGGDTVKVVQTEHSLTYKFTLIETLNAEVLKAVHGDTNVTTTAATSTSGTLHSVLITSAELGHAAYVIEVKDGDARVRIVISDGQITEVGDITYSDGDVIGYEVTVECFPDENGVKATKYLDDGKFSA
ncbi:phage tail protein [Microbacterium sp. KR10-403]|uniref:phage tail tube protein n=1 Tax=Microbacterium sp. KR10-403 TaxID=3158581 RepID=UPI0032E3A71E